LSISTNASFSCFHWVTYGGKKTLIKGHYKTQALSIDHPRCNIAVISMLLPLSLSRGFSPSKVGKKVFSVFSLYLR